MLPISSKAMTSLVIIKFFGKTLSEALPLAIWMHIGTLLVSAIYLREEINKTIKRLSTYFSKTIMGSLSGKNIGLGQGFSALPEISRSGTTTELFLFRKFDSENALRYSYLMSIPAVLGAEMVLQIADIVKVDFTSLLAVVFSFIFGLLTINAFLKIAKKS